ncbi:serum amyloid A-5 protein-like [Leptodactylus fuscus]|uniref:serum amyloid A-5 protein-like n=1 Tax=Leptodactylus fuscus TaxID=238119 RepID=UPI003F4E8893
MKVLVFLLLALSIAVAHTQFFGWVADTGRNIKNKVSDGARFVKEAGQGSWDMARAYMDMREANYKDSDKYFHARGNYDAANRGSGGVWAAKVISDAREGIQTSSSGRGGEDSAADQRANEWGRSGRDPNHYRPNGLPNKY